MAKKNILTLPKFSKKTALFVILLALIGGLIIWRALAAGNLLTVQVPTTAIKPGDQFTVTVRVNSGSIGINAVGIRLNYDSSKVDFVSASNVGTPFPLSPVKTASGGVVIIDESINPGDALVTGDQLANTITFVAKAGITGSMSLSFAASSQIYDGSSQNILTDVSSQTTGGVVTFQAPINPPTISLSSTGTNFTAPANIALTPNITVDQTRTIAKVEYYSDQNIIGTKTSAPWDFTWSDVPAGNYNLSAKVTDSGGGVASSNTVTVTVGQTPSPPSVTLQTNTTSTTAPATIILTASATPFTGRAISKVEFFNGTASLGVDTLTPFTVTLNNVGAGTYNYRATATDNGSPALSADSAIITVTVGNPPPPNPSTPTNLTVVAGSLTSTGVSLSWQDNINPTGTTYRITRDGVELSTVITAKSFSDNSLQPQTTHTYSVKAVSLDGLRSSTQSNSVTVTTQALAPVEGDINGDRRVDGSDFALLIQNWGSSDSSADLNKNGRVDGYDFVIVFKNYGRTG